MSLDTSTLIADETLAQSREPTPGNRDRLPRGATLGRYVVLEVLGTGGMGTVYAAFDPRLDRRVALKVLHDKVAKCDGSGPARLHREAQVLARLTHPNVVTVHDVGIEGSRVYLAMELIEGQTLKAWLAGASHSVADTLACCVRAGRGLVAAHAQDLIHRDFKPDNVMVGRDGRVRVMDFGLARGSQDKASQSGAASSLSQSMASGELTATGTILGTPAYMSPEQFDGAAADARSDQFAFCVTVWFSLFGERPFEGDSVAEVRAAVLAGKVREPPPNVRVPTAVRGALERGLSARPSDRFPSLEALLTAITPRAPRYRGIAAMLAVLATTAVTIALAMMLAAPRQEPCSGSHAAVADSWADTRADAIRQAFETTKLPFAHAAWARTRPTLESFFERWVDTRTSVCRATRVLHTQSEARLDARMDCLDDALRLGRALLNEMETADETLVQRATTLAAALPDPALCASVAAHAAAGQTQRTAHERIAVDKAKQQLAAATARLDTARYERAIEATQAGLGKLRRVHAPSVRGTLLSYRARAEAELGRLDTAEATAREGLRVANAGADARTTAHLWISLVSVIGEAQLRPEAALTLTFPAQLAVDRADEHALRIRLRELTGLVLVADARAGEAVAHFEAALAMAKQSANVDEEVESRLRNNYSLALFELGRLDDALREQQASYSIDMRRHGEDHPDIAIQLHNLARIYTAQGEIETARGAYARSLALRRRILGPTHPSVADALLNLGGLNSHDGKNDLAWAQVSEASGIYTERLGPAHPYVGFALNTLGVIARAQERLPEALALHDRARATLSAHYGKGHAKALAPLSNRATVLLDLGRYADAEATYREVIALRSVAEGASNVTMSYPFIGLAQVLMKLDRNAEALDVAGRALALREQATMDPRLTAQTRFVMAMAVWAVGEDPPGALDIARRAANTTRPDGPTPSALHSRILAWIDARTPS